MARFRTLSGEDVVEILRAFGEPAYQGHVPVAAGTINTNLRVETAGGPRFLRINEGKSREDIEREAEIVLHVTARGVPTPAPVPTLEGQPFTDWRGHLVSLFPWLPGRTLERAEVSPAHARETGRVLAALHLAGRDFPDHHPGRYEADEIQRRFARIVASGEADLAEAVAVLGPELQRLRAERVPDLPQGVIHGDLFIDNVLFDYLGGERVGAPTLPLQTSREELEPAKPSLPHAPEVLVALLDFEQASWGTLVYDLAVSALAFGFGADDFRPEVVAALLGGYASLRPPTAAERGAFGAELRFAACRFAVTRITDVYLKRDQGAPPGKDFRRYLARLQKIRERLARGEDRVLALP